MFKISTLLFSVLGVSLLAGESLADSSCTVRSSDYLSGSCYDQSASYCLLQCAQQRANLYNAIFQTCGTAGIAAAKKNDLEYCGQFGSSITCAAKNLVLSDYLNSDCLTADSICTLGCASGFSNFTKAVESTCGQSETAADARKLYCKSCADVNVDPAKYLSQNCLSNPKKVCQIECSADFNTYVNAVGALCGQTEVTRIKSVCSAT
jgi:hypothetical protein